MAATVRILKLTNLDAIVKIDGTAVSTTTITLNTLLRLPTEVIDGTPAVNIVTMQVAGAGNGFVHVVRNGIILWTLQGVSCEKIDLNDIGGVSDNTLNTHNIEVRLEGAAATQVQFLMRLRKVAGYRTTINTEQTGV